MKKICVLFFIMIMALGIMSCNKSEAGKKSQLNSEEGNMEVKKAILTQPKKTLVVYFSRTGNTKKLAGYAIAYTGADAFEIIAKDPYTDADIDHNDTSARSYLEQNDTTVRPEIDGVVDNMSEYDTIILAYPIWFGQAPRIIDTFLEEYDLSGKTIIPFCTSGSSGIASSEAILHRITGSNVKWMEGKRFAADTNKDEFIEWLSGIYEG